MKGLLVVAVMTLSLAGCDGSSTHAVSGAPETPHTGTLNLSRSWTSGSASGSSVSNSEDRVTDTMKCSTPSGEKICAAVVDFRARYTSSDARCLGRAPIGVRGVVDGTVVRLRVPIPGCLTGQLRHDAQLIDVPYLTPTSAPAAATHWGRVYLSRSAGSCSSNVSCVGVGVSEPRFCHGSQGAAVCAAAVDYKRRFLTADLRCKLGPGTTQVRGTIDGRFMQFMVPPVRCLSDLRLQHDAQVIDLPSPM